MLSTKDLVFKEGPAKKLVDWYISSYTINEVFSTNTVRVQLPTLMRIHPIVNVSQIVWYKEQIGEQKVEEVKPVKVEEVEEWEVEKIIKIKEK